MTVGLGADEYVVEGASANLGLGSNITETLIALTPEYGLQPLLAERWEFRPPNTWRFFLRRGVTFHNGAALNAQAVKEGLFDRVANPEFGGTTIGAGADSAVVVGDLTLDFTPTEPNLRVPQQIVHPVYGVFAPGTDPGTKPVGTGPFEFVAYAPQERLEVKRYDGYWGEKARSDGLTFRFYPDSEVRRLALEGGEIDVATLVRPADVAELEGKGFRIARSEVGAYDALYANIHKPDGVLSNLQVRQAVASAIDRKAIVEQLLEGQATADPTMVPPAVLGPHASMVKGLPYDPVKAEALLDQAGWIPGPDGIRQDDGRRLELTLAMGSPSSLRPVAEFVQAQLRNVGIAVEIAERPDPVSYGEMITSGAGDLYLEEGNQNDANPAFLPVVLFYSGSTAELQDYAALFAPGPQFDRLLAPAVTEEDPERVQMATAAAMHNIVDEQAVVIPLAGIYGIYGLDEDIEGFVPYPSFVNTRWDRIRR
ncbi:MAG: ABC transporter substrate-binding protein [Actinomycetota bacterium]|nr:ABC transporter substrate-binding protein [Actinomycetota bacterium]